MANKIKQYLQWRQSELDVLFTVSEVTFYSRDSSQIRFSNQQVINNN